MARDAAGRRGKQTQLTAHFFRINCASSKEAACAEIESLTASVEREAMNVLESQCEALVNGKVQRLRKARATVKCAEKTAGAMESKVEPLFFPMFIEGIGYTQ